MSGTYGLARVNSCCRCLREKTPNLIESCVCNIDAGMSTPYGEANVRHVKQMSPLCP